MIFKLFFALSALSFCPSFIQIRLTRSGKDNWLLSLNREGVRGAQADRERERERNESVLCRGNLGGICIQKSGTAILLFRFIRLWYCLYIQTTTLKPTPYAQMRAICAYIIYIPMGILCCNVLYVCEFTRFRLAKTKRVRRLLLCPVSLPQQGTWP